MRNRAYYVIITALLLAAAFAVSFFLLNVIDSLSDNHNKSEGKVQFSTSETAEKTGFFDDAEENDSNIIYIPQNGEDLAYQPGNFVEIDTGEKSNVGHVGYSLTRILPEGATVDNTAYEDCMLVKDFYAEFNQNAQIIKAQGANGKGQSLYTGHTIYSRLNTGTAESVNHDNTGNWRYIKNGYDLLELNAFDNIPEDEGYLLRKENSDERIRLFDTQEELDKANKAWEDGQAILNGQTDEIQGGIILDGCLLDGITWQVGSLYSDESIYVPLKDIALSFSSGSYETTTGVLHIPTYEGCGDASIEIPSTKSVGFENEVQAFHINEDNKTWHYNAWGDGALWEDDFRLTTDNFYMPAEWASRLTGWTFYFDGVMLNIVTEPCNVNNNFILRQ